MKRLISVLVLGSAVWLSGCAVHERVAPEAVEKEVADLIAPGEEAPRPRVDWWRAFGDETLNALVEKALLENASLDQAEAGVRKAEAYLAQQKAADLPGVNLEGAVKRSRRVEFGGEVYDSWSISGAVSYELDFWGRRKALKTQRLIDRDASLAGLASAMVTVSSQVAETWYLLVERQSQVALAQSRVALLQERMSMVAYRYDQGVLDAQQVYNARTELATEEALLEGLYADVAVAGHALDTLLNQKPGPVGSLPTDPFPDLPSLARGPLSSRLILGRPDMVQALKQVELADESVAIALADRFPSFSLTAAYGRSGAQFNSLSGTDPLWNVGGNLLAPLVDWGARKAKVKADKAAFEEAIAGYRTTALVAFQEAEDALSRCRRGETATAHVQEALKSAVSNTAYVERGYLQGSADYLTLLSSRIVESEAKGRLLTQQRQLLSHRIGLARALGGSFSDARSVDTTP